MGATHAVLIATLAVTGSQRIGPKPESPQPRVQTVNQGLQPRVVCGTVVIPVKPDADARMIVRLPKDNKDYKIRKIAPPMCNE